MKLLLFLDTNKHMASKEMRSTLQLRIYYIPLPISECQSLGDKSKNPTDNQNGKIIFIPFVWHTPTLEKCE